MNCLFCKQNSDDSKSVEHIIPESLGNKKHVLPRGYVCDSCNIYFATKVEKEVLEQPYFRSLRHRNDILSKKGRSTPEKGIIAHPQGGIVDIYRDEKGIIIDAHNDSIRNLLSSGKVNKLYIPFGESQPLEKNTSLSRLLAKIAIEALLYWIIDDSEWIIEVTEKPELDDIKRYARYGGTGKFWPYSQRRLYSEGDQFLNVEIQEEPYEVLHEFRFFWTKEMEFYFVIVIMGIEYAMNMGDPSINTYETWLEENNHRSILEWEKEKRITNTEKPR